jgi:peptide/nickel transport system substrate-binding protein
MRKRLGSLLAVSAIVFAACGGTTATTAPATPPPASTAPTTSTAPASAVAPSPSGSAIDQALFATNYQPPTGAKPGGTLVIGEWQAPDNLNPFFTTATTSFEAIGPAMRGLVIITSDGKYIPDLATTIPTLENGGVVISGTTFTVAVTMRPGLMWSDGTPMTMNDWKATWTFANDPAQSGCVSCTSGFPEVSSIDVSADGLSATLHFKELYAGWLSLLTSQFFQAKWLGTIKVADASKSMPVSSAIASVPFNGPFMITNASATEIDYAPNPNWHAGVDLAVGGTAHAPYLAGLKFKYYNSKDGMIADFKSGAIDLALNMTAADYAGISTTDPSIGTVELNTGAWQYEHLDVYQDPNHTRGNGLWMQPVRQAIEMAINKPDLIAAIFPGATVPPACSPTVPTEWYAKVETCPAYDVAGANSALDPIMPVGSDGNRQLNGKDVNIEMCTTSGNPTRLTELQKVQGDLTAVHIKSYIKTADAGSVYFAGWTDTTATTDCSIYRGTYDLALFTYSATGSPYNDYYYIYATAQWPEKGNHGGSNDTRFSDPTMDAALTALGADVDFTAQQKDAAAVQDAYVKGVPEIALWYRAEVTGIGAHLGGWTGYNPSSATATWETEDWFSK